MIRLTFSRLQRHTILGAILASALIPALARNIDCNAAPLAQQYARMFKEDQAMRGRYIEILELEHRKAHVDPVEKEKLEYQITAADEANQNELASLIKACGWPGKLDNKQAARAAFLIIQHAPLPYQLRYLSTVKAANARGEVANEQMAWLVDRILVRQGKPQQYGTDFDFGSKAISPVEDPKRLNQRRKKIGLPPLPQFPM